MGGRRRLVGSSIVLEVRISGHHGDRYRGIQGPSHTTREDTMEKLDFEAMSRIVLGMYGSIVDLTQKQY